MAAETTDEAMATETPPTDTAGEVTKLERGPDLVWDKEAPGLCVRVYGNGAQSFLFVYRLSDRQRCLRIGNTPRWSLAAARNWAKGVARRRRPRPRPRRSQSRTAKDRTTRERRECHPLHCRGVGEGFLTVAVEPRLRASALPSRCEATPAHRWRLGPPRMFGGLGGKRHQHGGDRDEQQRRQRTIVVASFAGTPG